MRTFAPPVLAQPQTRIMQSALMIFFLLLSAASAQSLSTRKSTRKPLAAFESSADTARRVWWDRFGTANKDFICYEPALPGGTWGVVGQRGQQNHDRLQYSILSLRALEATALAAPTGFQFLWDDRFGTNIQDASLWRPDCPAGYVALGDVFYPENYINSPGKDLYEKFRCVRADLTQNCGSPTKVWDDGGSTSWYDVSVWEAQVNNTVVVGGYLYGNNKHDIKPSIQMHCLLRSTYGTVYDMD